MRSSKSRSRSKNNRNRPSGGNIVNRVFDSSGPEGKVRGTPQQIIEKYNQLHRDAQLSGDRVAAENFAQHAEHYTRMLAEAQREIDQRREQQEQQHRERQQQQNQNANQGGNPTPQPDDSGSAPQPHSAPAEEVAAQSDDGQNGRPPRQRRRREPRDAPPQSAPASDDVLDVAGEDTGLVETPESKPAPRRRARKAKTSEPENTAPSDAAAKPDMPKEDSSGPAEAAE